MKISSILTICLTITLSMSSWGLVYAKDTINSPKSKQAMAWKNTAENLIDNKRWKELGYIEEIGTNYFSDEKIWQDKKFEKKWNTWLFQKSILSWSLNKEDKSIWKLSMDEKYSMGITTQNNSIILMFVYLDGTWNCPQRCNIFITPSNNNSFFLPARPSLDENKDNVSMIGSTLMPGNMENKKQTWLVAFPDGKSAKFDVSYLSKVYQEKLF